MTTPPVRPCRRSRNSVNKLGQGNVLFTFVRDLEAVNEGFGMSIERDCRVITRGALSRPGATLILGLLLTRP